MAPGLGGGLEGGGSLGIIIAIVTVLITLLIRSSPRSTFSFHALWRGFSNGVRNGLLIGGLVGAFACVVFSLSGGVEDGLYRGSGAGLFSGLLTGLMTGLITGLRDEPDSLRDCQAGRNWQEQLSCSNLSIQKSVGWLDRLCDFLLLSGCAGIGFGGVYALLIGGMTQKVIMYGSVAGLFFGAALSFGEGANIIQGLGAEIKPAEVVAWSWTSAGRGFVGAVKQGILIALSVTIGVVIVLGCASGFFYGAGYGLRYGLVYGPIIGLIGGIAGILTGVFNSGWSSTILAEHQLFQPNEGIRRSLKHALFAACLFGPVGGLASGLICGVAFGLVGGLASWPILGMGFALILGMIFALQFALLHGGIAWIEHYVLRWYLWRAGWLSRDYVHFLEHATARILLRKVGGGYMFVHRLLLEYFASLDSSGEDAP